MNADSGGRAPRAPHRLKLTIFAVVLFAVGLAAAMTTASRASTSAHGSSVTPQLVDASLRAQLTRAMHSTATMRRLAQHRAGRTAFRSAGVIAPMAHRAAKGDGITLLEPANGSSWVWAPNGYLHFTWYNAWYCPCDGVEVMLVLDSAGNHAFEGSGVCPGGATPSCPTFADVSLNPGHYTWAVGVQLGSNPVHLSDVWSFDIVGPTTPPPPPPPPTTTVVTPPPPPPPPPPPTTTVVPPPPPPPATTTSTTTTTTTTTAATPPADPPTTTPAPPAPKCHVPNVKGMLLADAQLRIFNRNCALGKVTRAASPRVHKGRVISQSPAAGRMLPNDTPVRLLVSRGK